MESKHCIQCNELINITATFCPFCTAKQPVVDKAKEQTKEEDKKFVPKAEYPMRKDIKDVAVVEKEESPQVSEEKKHQMQVEKKKQEQLREEEENEKIKFLAYHDELTGLLNRQSFKERLEQVSPADVCIGSVDANNLKKINDTMGHKYGDELLQAIADALSECFEKENVYRIGGDEFAVVLEGERSGSVDGKVNHFLELLEQQEEKKEHAFEISASVGFAYGDGELSIKEISEQADRQMYETKRKKKQDDAEKEKIEELKNNPLFSDGEYNVNHDHYYDDVAVIEEAEDEKLSKEVIKKAACLVVIFIVLEFFYLFFL